MNEFECEFPPPDPRIFKLASRYVRETEAYDRTVCSGPIIDGSIRPIGYRELGLVNRHAIKLHKQIFQEARAIGLDIAHLRRAIQNFRD